MVQVSILGNVALDHYVLNPNDLGIVEREIQEHGIVLNPEPKQVVENVCELLSDLDNKVDIIKRLGGGGYNSLQAFLQLYDVDDRFVYCDLSRRPLMRGLDQRVDYNFMDMSGLCSSLVLELSDRRKILKTERYDRDVKPTDFADVLKKVEDSDFIFINSIANNFLAMAISGYFLTGKPKKKYIVVTKNFCENRLTHSGLLYGATAIMDMDEAGVFGIDSEQTLGNVGEVVSKLRDFGAKNVVVTLGKNGAVFYDWGKISVVSTVDGLEEEIQEHIRFYKIPRTGAGDFFAAGLTYYSEQGQSLEEAITNAQRFVLEKKFRFPELSHDTFKVTEIGELVEENSFVS